MPYKIIIRDNQTKADIAGVVFLYDSDGNAIGESVIPIGGDDITDNAAFDNTTHIEVNASGYYSYGLDTSALFESTVIYLVKREVTWKAYVVGGLIVYIGMNILAKRSTKIL